MDADWLSGRMPDSRAREHRHESSYGLHIGAVDGDSLWRCYAMTTQNHCTCYFVINRDFFLLCTHSVDNLFHTLMVLWENEKFLTSNLLCFFTSVKLCPLVILLSLISKKNIRINIFIIIQHLKHFYLIPLNIHHSSVVSPHSVSRSLYIRYLGPGIVFFQAYLCIS